MGAHTQKTLVIHRSGIPSVVSRSILAEAFHISESSKSLDSLFGEDTNKNAHCKGRIPLKEQVYMYFCGNSKSAINWHENRGMNLEKSSIAQEKSANWHHCERLPPEAIIRPKSSSESRF